MNNIHQIPVRIFAHEVLVVTNASKALTASVYAPAGGVADYARVQILTDKAYVYFDGTAADTDGELFNAGDVIELYGAANIAAFRIIRHTLDISLRVHYGRRQG